MRAEAKSKALAQALFEPKTVALIGASGDAKKNTSRPQRFLRKHGYKGRIVPVNPGRDEIFGEKAYPDLMSVPEAIEHAFIMVPRDAVAAAIKQCVEKKVLTATIYSDGFAETGDEGRRMQEEVMAIARAGNVRVLGPNCIGILSIQPSFALSVNAVLEMDHIKPGPFAIVSQSGSMTGGLLSRGLGRGAGFSKLITVGNEADIGVGELTDMLVDDPHTGADYRRDDWHLWDDIDGDGCDARQQALKAASTIPANVAAGCKVVSGNWISAYDGFMTSNPSELDIDHVVPLENAHISGGWSWDATQRRQYANDQFDLWAVSASANRSKGASPPNQWRPVQQGTWCEYAQRWTAIKIRWDLSATSAERDALGQMLDTCPPGTMFSLSPTPTTIPVIPVTTAPSASASSQPGAASTTYFANCAAARAAGVAPLHTGQPGYRSGLDRDGDGIACE